MTARELHVLRHAKAGPHDRRDHERALAPRGRRAMDQLARHVGEAGVRPDLALCSTARRARETLALVADALGSPPVVLEDGLYLASADDLLDRLRAVPDDVRSVLVVGHNPGLEELLAVLAGGATPPMPTGALASLTVAGSWSELAAGGARLDAFVVPRALPPGD